MFSNNHKISARQIRRTMTLEMLGVGSLLLPGYLARNCGLDGVFAMIAGAAGALLLLRLWNRLTRKRDLGQLLADCRKIPRLAVSAFYGAALLGIAAYMLYLLSGLIREQLLEEKFEPVILITLTAAAVFALLKGVESRMRVYEVIFWFLMIPLIVILGLACAGVNPDYWPPAVAAPPAGFAKSVYVSFLFFSLSSLFLFFRSRCSRPEKAAGSVRAGVITVLLLNTAVYLILIGIFQTALLTQLEYPIITLMSVVKLPGGFFERQDAFMMGIWFFCLFALLNAMLYYGKELLQSGCSVLKKRKAGDDQGDVRKNGIWAGGSGLAVLILATVFLHTDLSAEAFLSVYARLICPLMLLMPLILFAVAGKNRFGGEGGGLR